VSARTFTAQQRVQRAIEDASASIDDFAAEHEARGDMLTKLIEAAHEVYRAYQREDGAVTLGEATSVGEAIVALDTLADEAESVS
jgi:hypothetical protein